MTHIFSIPQGSQMVAVGREAHLRKTDVIEAVFDPEGRRRTSQRLVLRRPSGSIVVTEQRHP